VTIISEYLIIFFNACTYAFVVEFFEFLLAFGFLAFSLSVEPPEMSMPKLRCASLPLDFLLLSLLFLLLFLLLPLVLLALDLCLYCLGILVFPIFSSILVSVLFTATSTTYSSFFPTSTCIASSTSP